MEIRKIIYLKAVREMLETAQYKFLSALEGIDGEISDITPELRFHFEIHPCKIENLNKLKGKCWIHVYGLRNRELIVGSPIYDIAIENPKNLEEDEKRLRDKLNNAE